MAITVTSAVVQALLAIAREALPNECCGLLFGTADAVTAHQPAANVHPQPTRYFEIDPQALIDAHRVMRKGGPQLIGYYHSHPAGDCAPSATDLALAAEDGMMWAIIAEERLAFWRADESGFSALSYTQVYR